MFVVFRRVRFHLCGPELLHCRMVAQHEWRWWASSRRWPRLWTGLGVAEQQNFAGQVCGNEAHVGRRHCNELFLVEK